MAKSTRALSRLKLAGPCSSDWDSMTGNDEVRFCGHCARSVHNLSAMTRRDAEALVARSEGRLCVRYYRREDGAVLTADDPLPRRAGVRVATGAFAALIALNQNAVCQSPAQDNQPPAAKISVEKKSPGSGRPDGAAEVRGSVIAPDEAVINGARVIISDRAKKRRFLSTTDGRGEFRFDSLPPDVYSLEVVAEGFSDFAVSPLALLEDDVLRIDARMRVGPLICEAVEIRGEASVYTTIGTLGVAVRKGFWGRFYDFITSPYKKIFSR
jgi:hypothetical protein